MPEPLVLVAQNGAVCSLTLNRPAALNSFNGALHAALLAELDRAADDPSVRCVVLGGAGRAFCAGQDLTDSGAAPAATSDAPATDLGRLIALRYLPLLQRLHTMPVPVIAAVNGVAAGAGANLALNCDMVIAASSASFIQAFVRIGLIPDCGGTWLLPRLVGRARAFGLAMLGDKLSAADAERWGLIWQCVDDAALADTVATLAARLAALPTQALVATRMAFAAAAGSTLDEAMQAEGVRQSALGRSPDYLEGVAAFTAKRAPVFTDR